MSAQQFTPGPWKAGYSEIGGMVGIYCDYTDATIAYAVIYTDSEDECRANARLIAAAPELYAALAEQVAECFDDKCEMCARHEAILTRARGQ